MPRLTHLCLGMCSVSLLVLGLVSVPMGVSAAPGDPQGGPSGYSNGLLMYGSSQDGPQQYPQQEGPQQYSDQYSAPQESGPQQYGSPQYGSPQEGGGQYGGNSSCSSIHQIAAGENLSTIASDNGVSVDALVEANNIDDPNLIVEGQALCIPSGDSSHEDGYYEESGEEYGPEHESYPVEPGNSYDPSAYNQGGGSSSQPQSAPQQESYGSSPVKPGESYDPSAYNQGGGSSGQPQYAPQQENYSQPESYSEPDYASHEYESQEYESHDDSSCYDQNTYQGTPGKSYDPSYVSQNYPTCDPVVHVTATPVVTPEATPTDDDTTPPQDGDDD